MFVSETQIRVHYALTDQMGMVYHGHYAQFYEIGRGEAIRQIGYTYKDIEAMGIIMPVVDLNSKFIRPAKYDDLLTIKTSLHELPTNHKIIFHSEIYNEEKLLINTGAVSLYFLQASTLRKCPMPLGLRERLEKYFGS